MKSKNYLLISACLLLLVACKKDTPPELGTYRDGAFVINEGAFQSGTGTITFFEKETRGVTQDIYQNENGGNLLGNIAQSMTLIDGKAYILINNASKIEVVTTDEFKSLTTINGIDQPRYMLAMDNAKAYVSSWGADGVSGKISVIDLTSNTVQKTIEVGGGPERMVLDGDDLYITKSGGFGRDSLVLVLDTRTDEISDTIVVADNPIGVVSQTGAGIWVLSRGHLDFVDATNNTDGELVRIVNKQIVDRFPLSNGVSELVTNQSRSRVYFNMDGKVMKHDFDDLTFENEVFLEQSYYALAVDPFSDNLFCADAKDFASNGEIFVFDESGSEIISFEGGIIPSDFVFIN